MLDIESPNGIKKTIKRIRTREFFDEKEKENLIYWTVSGTPYLKLYLEKSDGQISSNWFDKVGVNEDASELLTSLGIDFNFSKPYTLISKMLQIASNKNSIILDSFAGSGTTAHAVLNLNKEDNGDRKFICIEMEDYAETITTERVKRVIKGYGSGAKKADGTEGSFDYYTLGLPIFVGENNEYLNEEIDSEKIREYIWFSETRSPYIKPPNVDSDYFLGKKEDTAYYFIYEKSAETTLDYDMLSEIKTKSQQYLIYADNCLLAKDFMVSNNIVFKKIPRDVTRF